MIKDFIEATRITYKWTKAGRIIGDSQVFEYDDGSKYNIFVCTPALLHCGIKPTLPGIACMGIKDIFGGVHGAYIVNEAWLELPKWVQYALLAHEEAHIINKDYLMHSFFTSLMSNLMRIFREPKEEILADIYAYEKCGQMYIDALYYLGTCGFDLRTIVKRTDKLLRK
jgi:hypothetical protein